MALALHFEVIWSLNTNVTESRHMLRKFFCPVLESPSADKCIDCVVRVWGYSVCACKKAQQV